MIKVAFLVSYYNPHLTFMLDVLAEEEGIELKVGLMHEVSYYRKGYNWDEAPDNSIYFKFWKGNGEREAFRKFARKADIGAVVGIFQLDTYWLARHCRNKNKPLFFLSEGLRTVAMGTEGFWKNLIRRQIVSSLNKSNVQFLTLGADSELDYKILGATKWKLWRFGYSVKPFNLEKKANTNPDQINLVFIGSFIERKRLTDVIDAIKIVIDEGLHFHLNIIGSGPLQNKIETQIKKLNLEKYIKLSGQLVYKEVMEELSNTHCLILSSLFDGWGAVLNEGMEASLPIIASKGVKSAPILIQEGVNGYIYETGDIEDLAKKLRLLYSRRAEVINMGKMSKEIIKNWRPKQLARKWRNLILQIAGVENNFMQEDILDEIYETKVISKR